MGLEIELPEIPVFDQPASKIIPVDSSTVSEIIAAADTSAIEEVGTDITIIGSDNGGNTISKIKYKTAHVLLFRAPEGKTMRLEMHSSNCGSVGNDLQVWSSKTGNWYRMNSEEGISGTRYTTDSNMIALRGNIKSAQKLSLRCAYEDETLTKPWVMAPYSGSIEALFNYENPEDIQADNTLSNIIADQQWIDRTMNFNVTYILTVNFRLDGQVVETAKKEITYTNNYNMEDPYDGPALRRDGSIDWDHVSSSGGQFQPENYYIVFSTMEKKYKELIINGTLAYNSMYNYIVISGIESDFTIDIPVSKEYSW